MAVTDKCNFLDTDFPAIAFAPEDVSVNNSDRLRALELLGKYEAMFADRRQHQAIPTQPASEPEERKE